MNNLPSQGVSPTRRDLLRARFTNDSLHIASLMVQAWPERIPALEPILNGLKGVEVHETSTSGRMIVTIEATSDSELLGSITEIEKTEGVLTVSLVYHQIDDEDDQDER